VNLQTLSAGVICTGFEGTSFDRSECFVGAEPFGGYLLFARNISSLAQTRALTDQIRAACAPVSPIIAADQEGGRVMRLRAGVVEIPSMMALGATRSKELALRAGKQMAQDIRRAGISLTFAPVLDLARESANTVIGNRSFGDDPAEVTRLAGAVAAGLSAGGVVATYKHFPGHGATAFDSHGVLPAVAMDQHTLRESDLAPFAALLPAADAVMSAHVVFESFEAKVPATLSQRLLTGVLRTEIGFGGLCFTDCMQMDAIAATVGSAQGAVRALEAGADCITISHSVALARQCATAIATAVESGRLALQRLQESYERVQALRRKLTNPLDVDVAASDPQIGREIAARAITRVRGNAECAREDVSIVDFGGNQVAAALQDVPVRTLALEPDAGALSALSAWLRKTQKRPIVLMRRAHLHAEQAKAIEELLHMAPDALLVSVQEPYDVECFPSARSVLATYGDDRPNMEALERVLFVGQAPRGILPVRLPTVR